MSDFTRIIDTGSSIALNSPSENIDIPYLNTLNPISLENSFVAAEFGLEVAPKLDNIYSYNSVKFSGTIGVLNASPSDK